MKIIFILALSRVDFEMFVKNHFIGFNRNEIVLLRNLDQLRGVRELRVIATEGFLAHGNERFFDEVKEVIKYLEILRQPN